jgi:hypothetical protein
MVYDNWGLRQEPFGRRQLEIDPTAGSSGEALARLQFLYDNKALGGLLAAPPGCGKTAVLKHFAHLTRDAGSPTAYVAACEADERFLLTTLLRGWAIQTGKDCDDSPYGGWQRISGQLQIWRIEDCRPVILLDDLDDSPQLRGPVERLVALAIATRCPLLVVVSSRPETAPHPRRSPAWRFGTEDRSSSLGRRRHEPFPHATARSPGENPARFHPPPRSSSCRPFPAGLPRQVSLLAELSLIAGAAAGQAVVDGETVETVFHELASLENTPTLEAVLR